jgi:hypothetical protein
MTNRLAISIVVGALLVAGAGYLVLRVVFIPQTSQNPAQQSPQGGSVIVPIVVTTTPAATTTQTQGQSSSAIQVASVEEARQNLLTQLQAREIIFDAVNGSTGSFAAVYKLYAGDIAAAKKSFPKAKDFSLHMASVDINDDGTAEVLVYEDLPGFCGTAGCPFEIYQNTSNTWKLVFSHLSLNMPALANVFTSSYNDLYLSVQVEGYLSEVLQYGWNGKTYAPKAAVATWDGAQFSPPQQ